MKTSDAAYFVKVRLTKKGQKQNRGARKMNHFTKAELFLEATKTRPHFSLPKVIIQVQTGLEYSTG